MWLGLFELFLGLLEMCMRIELLRPHHKLVQQESYLVILLFAKIMARLQQALPLSQTLHAI